MALDPADQGAQPAGEGAGEGLPRESGSQLTAAAVAVARPGGEVRVREQEEG